MTTSRISQAIHQVCSKILRDGVELNDGQLLESFIVGREAAALEALVGRHGPMVWGVCRRILPNHHDAEDAFQAAFLVLVRKASSIRPRAMVGNWLFGVARQTALKARATSAKRRAREKQLPAGAEPIAAPADLSSDLSELLDDELTKLPDKYRSVLILCGLQGKSLKEAARRMGLPEGTVASRLARGRAMLAKRLVRHGLAVSGVSLAALQAHQSASAGVSTAAISSTIKAATAAGVVSANVGALTNGVLKAMLLTKLMKTTTAALVILCVLGAGVIGLAGQKPEPQAPAKPSTQQAKKDKAPEQKVEQAKDGKEKDDPSIRYQDFSVSGRAVDQDGKPVSGATIFLVSTNISPQRLLATVTTEKDGQYTFKDAKLPYRVKKNDDDWESGSFEVFGKCLGRTFTWSGLKFLNIDPRFKDKLSKAVTPSYFPGDRIEIGLEFAPPKKVEGRIINEKFEPIAGVKVRIGGCDYVNTAGKEQYANYREFWGMNQATDIMRKEVNAVTDDKGRFEFSSVPPDVFCWLLLEHPDYADVTLYTSTADNPPDTHDEGHPVLRLPLRLTLHSVRTIKVRVRSKQDDKPLAGIRVSGYQKASQRQLLEWNFRQGRERHAQAASRQIPPAGGSIAGIRLRSNLRGFDG
jgi:RNA polymerase sigma factor (sigma-70 family)